MPSFKVIVTINSDGQGFTETYYWSKLSGDFNACLTDVEKLIAARVGILSRDNYIKGVRITDLSPPAGPALPGGFDRPSTYLRPVQPNGIWKASAAFPNLAILVTLFDKDNRYRRPLILRGMPDSQAIFDIKRPFLLNVTPTYKAALQAFADVLTNKPSPNQNISISPWCILGRQKSVDTNFKRPILDVSISGDGTGRFTITTSGVSVFALGDRVHVHNVRACTAKGINGDHTVDVITVDELNTTQTLTLDVRQCCIGLVDYDGKASVYLVVKDNFAPIGTAQLSRLTTRATGAPFSGTRGRRAKAGCR